MDVKTLSFYFMFFFSPTDFSALLSADSVKNAHVK